MWCLTGRSENRSKTNRKTKTLTFILITMPFLSKNHGIGHTSYVANSGDSTNWQVRTLLCPVEQLKT